MKNKFGTIVAYCWEIIINFLFSSKKFFTMTLMSSVVFLSNTLTQFQSVVCIRSLKCDINGGNSLRSWSTASKIWFCWTHPTWIAAGSSIAPASSITPAHTAAHPVPLADFCPFSWLSDTTSWQHKFISLV